MERRLNTTMFRLTRPTLMRRFSRINSKTNFPENNKVTEDLIKIINDNKVTEDLIKIINDNKAIEELIKKQNQLLTGITNIASVTLMVTILSALFRL
jgi:hypothetical protein